MMEREYCDLSHNSLQVADIGRLMTLTRMPVIAGDSFSMNSKFLFRLNQLRRPLVSDIKMDVFAFFCPYRYTYPNWIQYIEQGTEEGITFPSVGASSQWWLATNFAPYPKHLWSDAARIWNFYFRDPSFPELSLDTPIEDEKVRRHGLKVANLKSWGTAQSRLANPDSNHFKLDTSGASITVFDIQERMTNSRNKMFRDFISSRYVEIMKNLSGAPVHDYSDDRPELIWRESDWMSGYDINATAGNDLGASVGKGVGVVNFNMPRRFFSEHGTLYIMAVLRMPPMFTQTKQFTDNLNRRFSLIVPQESNSIKPTEIRMSDVFTNGSSESLGYVPAYEWYRDHPSFVHRQFFEQDRGWQYLPAPSTAQATIEVGNYDSMFRSLKLRHAVVACEHRVEAWRPIPSAMSSLMVDI